MIHLQGENFEPMLRTADLPSKLFIFSGRVPARQARVMENDTVIGRVEYYTDINRNTLILPEFSKSVSTLILFHAFAVITAEAVRRTHPLQILSFSKDSRMKMIYPMNLYYPKGSYYKRCVEPWRYQVSDRCFDREGFLINQGGMEKLPFGWFSTREKGCGWIAAYNLLKLNGKEQSMQETAEGLSRYDVLGELFGENLFKIGIYLRSRGLRVHLAIGKSQVRKAITKSKNGILLYSHGRGSHFCAYRVRHDGTLYLFNAAYGKAQHRISVDDFFKLYAKGLKVLVLYVGQSEKIL